jgi:hypothetical protein
MTRFVSTSIALLCILTLLLVLGFDRCGGPHPNGNGNGNGNALANASPHTGLVVDCNLGGTTNDQIIKAAYDGIAGSAYAKEVTQFNITASKPEVKIIGWSTNKSQIVGIIKTAASGCTVNDTNFADSKPTLGANYQQRIGCPPGYGPCGDICIPVGEPCKVTAGPAAAPVWNCVAAPTPTP